MGASNLQFVLGVQDPNQFGNNDPAASGTADAAVNVAGQVNFTTKAMGVAPGYFGLPMKPLTLGVFGLAGSQKVYNAAGLNGHAVDVYGYGVYTFVPVLKSKDGKSRAMTMSLEAQGYISAGMTWNKANAAPATVGVLLRPALKPLVLPDR